MKTIFGEDVTSSVPFYVGVFAPTISAVVVTAWRGGKRGLKELFRRLIEWRVRFYWILIALFIYPALWMVWELVEKLLGLGDPGWNLRAYTVTLSTLLATGYIFLDPGPLGEELGWRGFALPRLLKGYSAIISGLVLGAIWSLWHLPAFFVAGTSQASIGIVWFLISGTMFSVLITWLFVNVRGSVWIAGILPHLMANASSSADIYHIGWQSSLVLTCLAILLVILFGKNLKRRQREDQLSEH